jgi:hypothetical protein
MDEALVIKREQHIQCLCGKKECCVKRPSNDDYPHSFKERRIIYDGVCKFSSNLSYISSDDFLLLCQEMKEIICLATIYDCGGFQDIVYLKVINILIHKNKPWLYSYLHEIPTLYTSRIPSDILHLILEYVSKY